MQRYCRWLITAPLHPAGLTENCRGCATESLQFFKDLKSKTTLQRADPASIRIVIQKILYLGQVRDMPLITVIYDMNNNLYRGMLINENTYVTVCPLRTLRLPNN